MANNQLLASDNFASGSLAASWVPLTVLGYNSPNVEIGPPNFTQPTALNIDALICWAGMTWPNDHTSEITVKTLNTEANTFLTLGVRIHVSDGSGYYVNWVNGVATLSYYNGSTSTSLGTFSGTVSSGDVIALQAAGSSISLYQNSNRVLFVGNAALTGGAPGYGQYTQIDITHVQVYSWRGYSAVQQDGIWQKQNVVLAPTTADLANSGIGVYEGSCIYDTNPQILTQFTNVYKLWFSVGSSTAASVNYAESPDLINWTRHSGAVIANFTTPQVIKVSNTYYLYCQAGNAQGTGNIAYYTSSDGINWTQQSNNVLSQGAPGQWDHGNIYPLKPVGIINGTWYALYGSLPGVGNFSKVGLVTSTDGAGAIWTKYSGNPVISTVCTYPYKCVAQVGSTFYVWMQKGPSAAQNEGTANLFDPVECIRYSTTDFINWSAPVYSLHHSQMFEALNTPVNNTEAVGGNAPIAIFDVGGKATMLYGVAQGDSTGPQVVQYALAIAPTAIANVVQYNEDAVQQTASDSFSRAAGSLGPNWTTFGSIAPMKIVAGNLCEPSVTGPPGCAAVYIGSVFSGNQYSEITINTLSASNFISPGVLMSPVLGTGYYAGIDGPAGTQGFTAFMIYYDGITANHIGPGVGITPNLGDVLRLTVIQTSSGPILSLFQNGSLITQITHTSASALTSGSPGLLGGEVSAGQTQISSWAGGNANVLPPYPPGPNPNPPSTPSVGSIFPGTFFGSSLNLAFSNSQGLDILQVVNDGEAVVWNLNAVGIATVNPTNPTPTAVFSRFQGNSFMEAFPNPGKLDILQVVRQGGSIVFHVDYLGNANTP